MPHNALRIIALLFIALVLLQSLMGGALFSLQIGLTPSSVAEYYANKTLHGLLEVVVPHTLFIAIALGATLHFLSFVHTLDTPFKSQVIHLLFSLFFIDQFSVFAISQGYEIFALIKLCAFIGFELLLGWIWIVIFNHTLKEME